MQVLTEGFSLRIAKNALCRRVPIGNPALRIHHQNRVLCGIRDLVHCLLGCCLLILRMDEVFQYSYLPLPIKNGDRTGG